MQSKIQKHVLGPNHERPGENPEHLRGDVIAAAVLQRNAALVALRLEHAAETSLRHQKIVRKLFGGKRGGDVAAGVACHSE